jgi:exodeoxyribonuclease III
MRTWTIASFNVNSIRMRLPVLINWLARVGPDVVCLQETKSQDRDFPEEEIREAGYHVVYRGEKAYNGVAIISASEPTEVSFGFRTPKDPDESRLVAARIDGIAVVNTYVPQGRDVDSEHFQYKLKWFDRMLAYFKKSYTPDQPLVWVGDLNVAPLDIDVHNPVGLKDHVDCHPLVKAKLAKVMDFGFTDVFRRHHPEPGQYTFWDFRLHDALDRGLGWRVDHILATPPLARRSLRAWIDPAPRRAPKPSDHTPILAEFRLD